MCTYINKKERQHFTYPLAVSLVLIHQRIDYNVSLLTYKIRQSAELEPPRELWTEYVPTHNLRSTDLWLKTFG